MLLLCTRRLWLISLLSVSWVNTDDTASPSTSPKSSRELVCPDHKRDRLPLLTLSCKTDEDCRVLKEQCCEEDGQFKCRRGVPKPKPERKHRPALLGLIPRQCPVEPITETFPVKNCTRDSDCWPRICCQDGIDSYCRTAAPQWDRVPRLSSLKRAVAYLQCTPPPPPAFDVFPKPCRSTIDCFPNLCCQEKDRKVCRPPKKSLLALIASIMQV